MTNMFKFFLSLTTTALLAFTLVAIDAPVYAATAWKVDFNVSVVGRDDSNRLILGAADDATDGFENGYENRAIMVGFISTYFYHPEWGVDTDYFWTDIRDTSLPKQWQFYVSSGYLNRNVNMRWVRDVPDGLTLSLLDEDTGATIDMRTQSFYEYLNTSTVARSFIVEASGVIDVVPPVVTVTGVITDNPGATGKAPGHANVAEAVAYKLLRRSGGNNTADSAVLWPANDRVADVVVQGSVVDVGSGLASLSYAVVDEYGQNTATGSITPDADGNFSFTVPLAASIDRADIDGRLYRVTITAVDAAGNISSQEATVLVSRTP